MPQCPVCGKIYPDQTTVCLEDGTDLANLQPAPPVEIAVLPEAVETPQNAFLPPPPEPAGVPPIVPPVPTASARILLKRSGTLTGDAFPLGEETVVGRFDPESGPVDVDLGPVPEAVYISRRHAEFRRDADGQWRVRDLGSRNGTFLRSQGQGQFQRIADEQLLTSGDEVALGNARFEFRVEG